MTSWADKHAFDIAGRKYVYTLGSDLTRNGMYLELSEVEGEGLLRMMEIFHDDGKGCMTLNTCHDAVPLAAAEWLISRAKELLLPEHPEGGHP
jgi:hypothetical protein